jgi:hypothetical protein
VTLREVAKVFFLTQSAFGGNTFAMKLIRERATKAGEWLENATDGFVAANPHVLSFGQLTYKASVILCLASIIFYGKVSEQLRMEDASILCSMLKKWEFHVENDVKMIQTQMMTKNDIYRAFKGKQITFLGFYFWFFFNGSNLTFKTDYMILTDLQRIHAILTFFKLNPENVRNICS